MSYSLYISCESKKQRDELFTFLKENFIFPDENYQCYIGTDLCYVRDEFKKLHVGFELNAAGYLSHLCIICLSIIARKKNLKVYWDDTDLKVSKFKDENLLTLQSFLSRNKPLIKYTSWSQIKSSILVQIGFYLEERSIRKLIYTRCNQTIQNFIKM